MARVFADYKYETNSGTILFTRMKISAKKAIAANVEPTAGVDENIRVDAGSGRRENGLKARKIILTRSVGTGADEVVYTSSLVKLTQGSTIALGTTVTIDGVSWKVASIEGEITDVPRFLTAAA